MAIQLILKRQFSGLVPVTGRDEELISEIPIGRDMTAELRMARSQKQNSFYWTVLGKVVSNHPFYRTSKALHVYLKTRLGLVDEVHFHDGEISIQVSSTAFDKMDSIEFKPFMDAALLLIVEEVLPGVKRSDLIREVERMLGFSYDALFPDKKKAA